MPATKLHVKKDDRVVVISGKDKGKTGKVLTALPKESRVIVEGVNIITKHRKGRSNVDPGGIIHHEAPVYASKVMLMCPRCGKATRAAHIILDNGSKVRICKKCKETFES